MIDYEDNFFFKELNVCPVLNETSLMGCELFGEGEREEHREIRWAPEN